jgi:hypothetical protein
MLKLNVQHLINLTPHDINIYIEDGKIIKLKRQNISARVKKESFIIGTMNDIPITTTHYYQVENLPDYKENILYIVSKIVYETALNQGRTTIDLFLANDLIRDDKGNVTGCRSISKPSLNEVIKEKIFLENLVNNYIKY